MANTPQQVIDVGAVANDGTGDSLRQAFIEVNDNFANIWAVGPVSTNVVIANNEISTSVTNMDLILAGNGIGNVQFNSSLVPRTDDVYDLGTLAKRFSTAYIGIGGLDVQGPTTFLSNISAPTFIGNVVGNITGNLNVPGDNTQVIFNTNDSADASSGLTFNKVSNVLTVGGNVSAVGNVSGNYILGNGAFLSGVITSVANINNGTSNVNIASPGANITVSVGGTPNVAVFASTGEYITGLLNVTGNITAPNFIGNVVGNITGNITVPGTTTEVLFNTNGAIDASTQFTFNKNSNVLAVSGNINSTNYFVGDGSFMTSVMADRGNDTNNWNALTQMGVYTVNRTSWSGVSGPPLDSLVFVGLLEVKTSTGNSNTTEQIFYPGTIDSADVKIQYNRSLWDGTWTPWVRMTNNGQLLDGGTF